MWPPIAIFYSIQYNARSTLFYVPFTTEIVFNLDIKKGRGFGCCMWWSGERCVGVCLETSERRRRKLYGTAWEDLSSLRLCQDGLDGSSLHANLQRPARQVTPWPHARRQSFVISQRSRRENIHHEILIMLNNRNLNFFNFKVVLIKYN